MHQVAALVERMPMLIKACLNGSRLPGSHPALPLTPDELAVEGQRAVAAGAGALHFHPRGADGLETLAGDAVAAALVAVRHACPGIPIGVSTGAWIEPDIERRLWQVRAWKVVPDFASVNFSEAGTPELCTALLEMGIGVEAGLWSPEDAQLLLALGIGQRCTRVLIELVGEQDLDQAVAAAEQIVELLDDAAIQVPRLLHGEERNAWPLLDLALARGFDIRIGLEDTLVLPDGTRTRDNATLVAVARQRAHAAGRLS